MGQLQTTALPPSLPSLRVYLCPSSAAAAAAHAASNDDCGATALLPPLTVDLQEEEGEATITGWRSVTTIASACALITHSERPTPLREPAGSTQVELLSLYAPPLTPPSAPAATQPPVPLPMMDELRDDPSWLMGPLDSGGSSWLPLPPAHSHPLHPSLDPTSSSFDPLLLLDSTPGWPAFDPSPRPHPPPPPPHRSSTVSSSSALYDSSATSSYPSPSSSSSAFPFRPPSTATPSSSLPYRSTPHPHTPSPPSYPPKDSPPSHPHPQPPHSQATPFGHWASPTTSPPSSDFTSPRSLSSLSSASTSTPVSPLTLTHPPRSTLLFHHGQHHPHQQQVAFHRGAGAGGGGMGMDFAGGGAASPPIFSSSHSTPPQEHSRLLQGVVRAAADGAPHPGHSSPSIKFSGMALHQQSQQPLLHTGQVGGGDGKERKLSSIRRARREVTTSPLMHPLPRVYPSFSSPPALPSSSTSSPSTSSPLITTASALPFPSPPTPPPPAKRKSSRKFGVMIDVPIKPSPSSTSPPKRKGGSRALTPAGGVEGVEGVVGLGGAKAVVAIVSPLQGDRHVGLGRGGVAIAAAVNVRGAGGVDGAPMLPFDAYPGAEGTGWADQGEGAPSIGGFAPPLSRSARSAVRRFSSPQDCVDPQALPAHGGSSRQVSAPMSSSLQSDFSSPPSSSDHSSYASPSSLAQRTSGCPLQQQQRFTPDLHPFKREEQLRPQRTAPQPQGPWSDFPYREGGQGEHQPAPHPQGEWLRQPSPPFSAYSPSVQDDGFTFLPRSSAAYLDDATSTAVLSTLAASLSHLHRATSAPAPAQLSGQVRERGGGESGDGEGRGERGERQTPSPSLLLQQSQMQQTSAALLAERQLQWMRHFSKTNPAQHSLTPDATAFLAALSAQLTNAGADSRLQSGAHQQSPMPRGGLRPPSSSSPPLVSDHQRPPPSLQSASLAQSAERQLRQLQMQIDAQQKHIQQRLQQHEGSQWTNGGSRGGSGGGYGQPQQQQRMGDHSTPSHNPLAMQSPHGNDAFASHSQRPHNSNNHNSGRPISAAQQPLPSGHGGARGLQTPCPLAASTGCSEHFSSLSELQQHYINTHMLG